MGNALNQLNLASGPGANGILASGGQPISTAGSDCQILSGLWAEFNVSATITTFSTCDSGNPSVNFPLVLKGGGEEGFRQSRISILYLFWSVYRPDDP